MISVFLYALTAMGQQASPLMLTVPQAERLVRIVAEQEGYNLSDKRYYFDKLLLPNGGGEPLPGYISFGLDHTPIHGAAEESLRYYVVDGTTGDVMEINFCTRYESTALGQQKLRLKLRPSKKKEQIENEIGCDKLKTKHLVSKRGTESKPSSTPN